MIYSPIHSHLLTQSIVISIVLAIYWGAKSLNVIEEPKNSKRLYSKVLQTPYMHSHIEHTKTIGDYNVTNLLRTYMYPPSQKPQIRCILMSSFHKVCSHELTNDLSFTASQEL